MVVRSSDELTGKDSSSSATNWKIVRTNGDGCCKINSDEELLSTPHHDSRCFDNRRFCFNDIELERFNRNIEFVSFVFFVLLFEDDDLFNRFNSTSLLEEVIFVLFLKKLRGDFRSGVERVFKLSKISPIFLPTILNSKTR